MRLFVVAFFLCSFCSAQPAVPRLPVDAEASPEARAVLSFLYSIRGKHALAAHHNYLGRLSEAHALVQKETGGKLPAVWGSDFGFSDASGDIDNIAYRPKLLEEALHWDSEGALITLTWHAANPVMGEPGPFKGNVQSKLSDKEWKDLITPGTELNGKWKAQMDLLAAFLKALENEKVPVLFRPWHEMNGGWFWWGEPDKHREFVQLWRMTYRHLAERHGLHNLIWVWSPSSQVRHGLEEWYPGDEYVDVVAADLYPPHNDKDPARTFPQSFYTRLEKIAAGRPMAMGEHGMYPTLEVLERQPNWCWFMGWVDLPSKDSPAGSAKALYDSERVVDLAELRALRAKE
ncbi:glycoside hydrolase family 26 protein [Nibricoccus sp. IMCC34717]|uniref:glycoside hydrolase family 26 protein n=1 Tax=Nibricoccus sp. IMCC34717 TaxID=3034021 RepID=UPI0038511F51